MQAAYFDYAPTARWYRNYSHNIHVQKLKEIEKASNRRIDQSEPKSRKLLPYLKRDTREMQKEKHESIQKQNMVILQRLNHLASRSATVRSSTLTSLKSPLSLNYGSRKLQAQKIVEENELMVKRLDKVASNFSNRTFAEEYKNATRYKKNISKKKWLGINSIGKKSRKLSPIEDTKLDVQSEDKSNEDNDN